MHHLIAKTTTEKTVGKIISSTVKEMGFQIVRIRYESKEKGKLQIMLDRQEGEIELSHCAKASRQISALLDVSDPIDAEYDLEVSSPGINRPLTRLTDFKRWEGYNARIKTTEKIDNRKNFRGILMGIKENEILLDISSHILGLEFDWIDEAALCISFENILREPKSN